jgi:hypothetical protein
MTINKIIEFRDPEDRQERKFQFKGQMDTSGGFFELEATVIGQADTDVPGGLAFSEKNLINLLKGSPGDEETTVYDDYNAQQSFLVMRGLPVGNELR